MIVICEECGKSYRIDPSKVRGSEARFSCKDCGNQITAPVPPPAKISEKTAPPTRPYPCLTLSKQGRQAIEILLGHVRRIGNQPRQQALQFLQRLTLERQGRQQTADRRLFGRHLFRYSLVKMEKSIG